MKIPKRLYIATAVILFVGGAGTALALQPATEPSKELAVRQVSAATSGKEADTPVNAAPEVAQPVVHNTAPAAAQSIVTPDSAPQPVPQPDPITVTSYEEIPVGGAGDKDCKFNYSDGTIYQWHWVTINPQGAWSETQQRWSVTTTTSGSCDQSVIGRAKS